MKTITVVAAIIRLDNLILCTQRSFSKYDYISYKYEFPGGKVESGETEEAALLREIHEELELDILVDQKYVTVDHAYPDFRLVMHSYLCTAKTQDLLLKEHVAFQWLPVERFNELDWAGADVPIVEALVRDTAGAPDAESEGLLWK